MGQLSTRRPAWRRAAGPWPRARRRQWVRPDRLAGVTQMFAAIPSLPRAELSRLTTRMIDRMDEIDGDPDLEATLEDDEPEEDVDCAHDDGCGPVMINGRIFWGSADEEPGRVKPIYGVDQSAGPTNQHAEWLSAQQEIRRD